MTISIATGSRIQIAIGTDGSGTGVTSVNGQTGVVTVTAASVGADPAGTAAAHINDTSAAHAASAISTSGHTGNISGATTVEAALDLIDDLDLSGSGGGGAVDSVNGETGVVVLSAADVGADPAGSASAAQSAAISAASTDATTKANAAQSAAATDATTKANAAASGAASALSSHESDTTNVHGITNTAALETTTGSQAKVDAHVNDTSAAHAASAISTSGHTGNLSGATDVEAALDLLDDATFGGGSAHIPPAYINGQYSPEPVSAASPPTVAVSATSTPTSGLTRIAPNGATCYTYPGVATVSAGTVSGLTNCVKQTGIDVSPSGLAYDSMRVEFETDAPTIDIFMYAMANATPNLGNNCARFAILVDGEYITAQPVTTPLTESAWSRITVPFGSVARRRVIIESMYTQFGGVAVDATKYKVWASSRDAGPKTIVFMDSFGSAESCTDNAFTALSVKPWVWGNFAVTAGRLLGWNVFPSQVGSTGWYNDGGFGQAVVSRFDTDGTALLPDQVVFAVGLNDRAMTLGSVQTAINTTMAAAAACVNASGRKTKVFALAPICTIPAYLTALTTIAGYVSTACATYGGTYIAGPLSYISGSGDVGTPTGDGNADIYLSADEIHLTPNGYDYIGRRLAGEIEAASRASRIGDQALSSGVVQPLITVEDEGSAVTRRNTINFTGSGVAVADTGGKTTVTVSSGGSAHTIEDEGSALTARASLNFVGSGVTAADSGGKTVVTIPGSSAPARDAVSLYRTSDQTWTPATGYETVNWTHELFDDNGYHSTVSTTDRIIIPSGMGGTYEFIANIHVTRSGQTSCQVRIKLNGSTTESVSTMLAGIYSTMVGNTQVLNVHTGPVALAATDYVTVEVYPDGSGALTINKDWSWFRMRRIA